MKGEEIPILIKVLAIFDYISIGFLILLGLGFLFAGTLLNAILASKNINIFSAALFIFLGIFCFCYGVLNIFIGMGLWRGKNWARVATIIFYILIVLVSIYLTIEEYNLPILSRIQYVLYAIIALAIIVYLLFSKKVKEAFKK